MAVEDEMKVVVVRAMKAKPKKGRGKGKAKARARKLVQAQGDGATAQPTQRIQKENLKAKIMSELETRDIADVLKEARERIALAEQVVSKIEGQEEALHKEGLMLKEAVEKASQNVNNVVEREVQAIEKLKTTKLEKEQVEKSVNVITAEKAQNDKFLAMLQAEWKNRSNSIEAGRAKNSAKEAAAAAKKAFAEQKVLEREAMANQKKVMQEQREREKAMMLKAGASPSSKARSQGAKEAKKIISHELTDFEKIRAARMKMRAQIAGKAKGGGRGSGKAKTSPGTPKRKIADVD